MAAYQRAPHQGRRLCLGRHRHHPHQGARTEAGRQRPAPARHRDRPEAFADGPGTAGPRACRPRREIVPGKDPRRESHPDTIKIPRQYEPRTAHAIIGFSEIMESGRFGTLGSEKYQEYCHDILPSGHYLLEVINGILDMSKIEAGRMKLDMEQLDLSKTLAESLRVVSGRAEGKNLVLDADIDGPISVLADRRAIKQIIVNL